MRRREFILGLGGVAVWPLAARAQHAGKIPRVGFMGNSTAALEANLVGPFRTALRELGYEEARNIAIEYRWAEGDYSRFPALVAELLAQKVDVIVTAGTPAALAVKAATTTVPLVMVAVGDPVGTGIVTSLGRPGGNIGLKFDCAGTGGQAAGAVAGSSSNVVACRHFVESGQSLSRYFIEASAHRGRTVADKIAVRRSTGDGRNRCRHRCNEKRKARSAHDTGGSRVPA